ncbi:MAG: ABC transporter ATP-binding protein [Lachnospiraceae bacterium]
MIKLIRFLKGFERQTILAPLFKMLEASFELIIPLVMAAIIDVGIQKADTAYIWKMCAIMILLGLIGFICSVTAQYYAAKATMGFGTQLRATMFDHIQRFSYTQIDKRGTSNMITCITSDINQAQTAVNLVLRLFLRAPFIVVGATILSAYLSLRMTLLFLLAIVGITLVIYFTMKFTVPYYKKVQNTLEELSESIRENHVGVRVVRAFIRQKDEKKKFNESNEKLTKFQILAGYIAALVNPLTYVIMNAGILGILWLGGQEVFEGSLLQGEVVALISYMTQILLALLVMTNMIIAMTKASASAIRINDLLAVPIKQESRGTEEALENAVQEQKSIEFRHVTFTYEGAAAPSLTDINLTFNEGETVGLIGGTGAGKSTLLQLIPGFYAPERGEVLVEGIPVKDYDEQTLKQKIGFTLQHAVLFSGTLEDNLKMGRPQATEEEMIEALERAQAAEFVMNSQGKLQMQIAQGGQNLSGGQKQRLTIARALIRKPDILILDDSSSALDYLTESRLRHSIAAMRNDMITIIASQRVASIRHADKIIVLEDGCIEGIGTHEELLAGSTVYREICHSQEVDTKAGGR